MVARRCATLAEFLVQAPEFASVGPQATGTLTVDALPAPGQVFVIGTATLTMVAGVPAVDEATIGGDVNATATNIATALNLAANSFVSLVTSNVLGTTPNVVDLTSVGTGPEANLPMSTDAPNFTLSGAALAGGEAIVAFQLACACSQINLVCWNQKADCGHIYLTGHFMAIVSGIGGSGTVRRKKIDKIEVEFQNLTFSDADLGSTKWGRLYLQIRKTLFAPGIAGRRFLARPGRFC